MEKSKKYGLIAFEDAFDVQSNDPVPPLNWQKSGEIHGDEEGRKAGMIKGKVS